MSAPTKKPTPDSAGAGQGTNEKLQAHCNPVDAALALLRQAQAQAQAQVAGALAAVDRIEAALGQAVRS